MDPDLTRFVIDEQFMRNARAIGHDGTRQNEVPIGALVVKGTTIISGANNRTVRDQDATAHAELLAIREACGLLDRWRLDDCTEYPAHAFSTLRERALSQGRTRGSGIAGRPSPR
jgi:pyrimidine deaminase RibD-like protein